MRPRAHVPGLEKRARRGEQEVGQAHRRAEQQQDAGDGLLAPGRLPALGRCDRQAGHGGRQQDRMHDRLAPSPQLRVERVRIGVAAKQQHLEEQHAGRPHRRAAAEPGQDQPRDERLHQEKKKR